MVSRFEPLRRLFRRGASAFRTPQGRVAAAAAALVLGAYVVMLWPMLADFSTYGFHDWDAHSAYRYITALSVGRYLEGPWWHPWLCGGVPAWGTVEGATNLISPYLPLYLWADIRAAIRLEVLGNGLLALAGAWVLARRFTVSHVLAASIAALYVLNGRWALQAAVGHTWHLQYAFLPWFFYCVERWRTETEGGIGRRLTSPFVFAAAALLAYLVYAGAIYPLPHTLLFAALYLAVLALLERRLLPLVQLAVAGGLAFGLAAPKLFAVADTMQKTPRLIESTEQIGFPELFVMLTDRTQRYGAWPVRVPAYNWHEWGLYVGAGGVLTLAVGLLFGRGPRAQALKLCGTAALFLGFGAFHEYAPWTLLHQLPVFSSQLVPSRFHYPMLLFFGLAALQAVDPLLQKLLAARPAREALLLVPLAFFAFDLVGVNQVPFTQAFWMRAPEVIPRRAHFEHRTNSPVNYVQRDWAAPMLLAMFANSGVLRCYGADPSIVPGAIAADAPNYRGSAYVADGEGRAEVVDWSPNRAVVRVTGAKPGALVVYNMNADPSWTANGAPALDVNGAVAAHLPPGNELRFSYFPRSMKLALPLCLATIVFMVWSRRRALRLPTSKPEQPSNES
jgi:hypothetical protein